VKLIRLGVRFQQRLLDDVRGVDPIPRSAVQLQPGEQQQIRAEFVQRAMRRSIRVIHGSVLSSFKRRAGAD
jgi:hypothetical protein